MVTLDAGGQRIEALWHGPLPTEAPTVVLLHEGLGCAAQWRDLPEAIVRATGCGVLAYSRPGYGGSEGISLPRPRTYMHREGHTVLPAVLAAAGVRETVLVGHSDGASIAVLHGGGPSPHPGLRGLVLLAPHVFCEAVSVRAITAAAQAYTTGALRARLQRWHGDNVDGAFWGWNRAWLHPDFLHWNIEDHLPGIQVPVCVIQGTEDPYGTLGQVEAIVRGCTHTRVTTVVLPGCGHNPQRDRPEQTLQAISRHVRAALALP